MKKTYLIITGLLFVAQASFAEGELPEKFTDGLDKARMTFEMPEGYTETETVDNPHMLYEYAIKHDEEDFEVRYAIRAQPDIELEILAVTVGFNISKNMGPLGPFPPEAIKKEFNADKGVMTLVETREEFGNGYKYCMMVGIFKEGLGTAFYFYMANEQETIKKLLLEAFHSLKFEEKSEEDA